MLRPTVNNIRVGLLSVLFAAGSLEAQSGFGIVRGTVYDTSNAAVPRAKITLQNQNTNISRETTLAVSGIYYFGEIQPGSYELTVEAEGFKKWIGTLTLEVGQTAVIDPTLEVGSVTSTIEVT